MSTDPYTRFSSEELILRDELAIDRTLLANERTLLAYARSGVALIVGGVTFLHFPETGMLAVMGVALLPMGALLLIFGYQRYAKMQAAIQTIRQRLSRVERPESSLDIGRRTDGK